jgi:hypothetical protein
LICQVALDHAIFLSAGSTPGQKFIIEPKKKDKRRKKKEEEGKKERIRTDHIIRSDSASTPGSKKTILKKIVKYQHFTHIQ